MGRVGKEIVKFCHPLEVAKFSMLLIQNSLCYVNIMTFESVLGVFCSRQVCFKELRIKLILLNSKHGAQRSHSETCSLKKNAHYPIFILLSNVLCCILESKKSGYKKSLNTFSWQRTSLNTNFYDLNCIFNIHHHHDKCNVYIRVMYTLVVVVVKCRLLTSSWAKRT